MTATTATATGKEQPAEEPPKNVDPFDHDVLPTPRAPPWRSRARCSPR